VFDLEQQIRQWRQAQGAALGGRADVLAELEGHLREEVQRQVQEGHTPEAAWESALARLGAPQQLAAEFAKVAPAASWLPARLVLFVPAVAAVVLAWLLVADLRRGATLSPLLAVHVLAVTLGYTSTFAVGALAAWAVLSRAVGGWDARRSAALRAAAWKLTIPGLALTAVGVVLGGWWAQQNWGRFWDWDLKETGGAAVVAWYALMLACLCGRRFGDRAALLLGVAGNVVVSLSWFGPALVPGRGLHAYGYPTYLAWLLGGFVFTQLLVLGLALVPVGGLVRRRA
jgi:hypothetical protein